MDKREVLFKASLEGSVSSLLGLLRDDPLILDRYTILNPYNDTPLHVASMLGHLDFVKEVLIRKPELAAELNLQRASPLHLASAKGYVEIVKELILVHPDMCISCDGDGLNPLHLAAMKGRVDVLKELLRVRVHAARAMVHWRETILHLCVKHNQLEALKLLMETLSDHEFVNSKDDGGHTILHLAVAYKQIKTVKFLLLNTSIEVNERNADGKTAMGILARSQGDTISDKEIKEHLIRRGVDSYEENENYSPVRAENHIVPAREHTALEYTMHQKKNLHKSHKKQEKWLEKKRNTLMVVASLIATMAFQAGMYPPSGTWQEPNKDHQAGFSIMAEIYPAEYCFFLVSNTTSFIASLSIILLLISGLPFRRRIFMWILMVIMWIAITATSLTFLISMIVLTPYNETNRYQFMVKFVVVMVWIGLLGILILVHTFRAIVKSMRTLGKLAFPKRRVSSLAINHDIV